MRKKVTPAKRKKDLCVCVQKEEVNAKQTPTHVYTHTSPQVDKDREPSRRFFWAKNTMHKDIFSVRFHFASA